MKNILIFALVSLVLASCKKDPEKVTYPDDFSYGENVLALITDNATQDVLSGKSYSFAAKLSKKATLKIVVRNTSFYLNPNFAMPTWSCSNESGWEIGTYNADLTQVFKAVGSGEIDLKIQFSGSPGSCTIEYYENSENITRTKFLKWN